MEVLDRVYKAFSNLESDFAKSGKTRTEFIKDKFGGDIEIGSVIILDAISNVDSESIEDINKISFIKKVIKGVRENANRLDNLTDFVFDKVSDFGVLFNVLKGSLESGMQCRVVPQKEIYEMSKGDVHYVATSECMNMSNYNTCNVYNMYNEHILDRFILMTGVKDFSVGDYVRAKTRMTFAKIEPSEVPKYLGGAE